jgi:hypothetical protein
MKETAAAPKPPWRPPELGRFFRELAPTGLSFLYLLPFFLAASIYATCTQYLHPDQFAVKQVDVPVPLITGVAGMHTNIYVTGVHWLMSGCEKFIVFPKSDRAVTLHSKGKNNETPEQFVRFQEAAHIQTSDGFFINLDVSILYRVVDPYKVVREFGAGVLYEQNGIIFQAEPTLKATMGTLMPEDFFNAAQRVAKQTEARDKFNEFLIPRGLKVDQVLIRYPIASTRRKLPSSGNLSPRVTSSCAKKSSRRSDAAVRAIFSGRFRRMSLPALRTATKPWNLRGKGFKRSSTPTGSSSSGSR